MGNDNDAPRHSLHGTGAVDVVGISYGAAIVTEFADRSPERVRSLVYIDPVFNMVRPLPPRERSAFAWSKYMVFGGGTEDMVTSQLTDFYYPARHPDWLARYRVQFQFKGTREALRRTRAAVAVAPSQAPQIRRVGSHPRPVLVVWGRQDSGAPFAESATLMAVFPRGTLLPVDSAGHLPYLDQPDIVVPAVAQFLRAAPTSVHMSAAQFRSLRWLEGSWRGTGAGPNAFYERYQFVNDTTIASHSYPDSTLSRSGDSSLILLSGGEIRNRGDLSEWVATALGGDSIHFEPWRGPARNSMRRVGH